MCSQVKVGDFVTWDLQTTGKVANAQKQFPGGQVRRMGYMEAAVYEGVGAGRSGGKGAG